MNKLYHLIFILLFIFFQSGAISQTRPDPLNIDSMLNLLKNAPEDSTKVNLLGEIAHYYSSKELEKAVEFAEKGLFLSKQIKFRRGEGSALLQVGNINNDLGLVGSAISNFEQVVEIADELKDQKLKMSALNNLGISYFNWTDYSKALNYYLKYTRVAEELNEPKYLSRAYNNVANVYIRLADYKKALEYHFKGLEIAQKLQDKVLIAGSYNNIGIVYKGLGKKEEALEYYFKTLKLAEELKHKLGMTFALNNIGAVYSEDNEPVKALKYILRALEIKRELGEQKGIANTLNNAGGCYISLKKFDQALNSYLESESISKAIQEKSSLMVAYEGLRDTYESKGDLKKAFEYFKLYSSVKDSIFNKEKSEQVTEMQTRFETEKKEKEIKLQTIEMEKKDALFKQQNIFKNALLAGFTLVLALAVSIFIAFRQKQKMNKILTDQNQKINQNKKLIEKAHSILENKNKDITESIIYAQRIQEAILPLNEELEKKFPDSFILYKPRDIVSGDFYWFSKVENLNFFAVADCTGHGVPGAFMSMIGNDILNQVVNDENVSNPAEILTQMDKKISGALSKSKSNPNTKDGMDMGLISVDDNDNILHFSGANRPLFLLRKTEIFEFKSINKTVGIQMEKEVPFELHTIPLEKGDCIYLFTDGFADQFGGPKNKKFLTKRFKEMLLSFAHLSMKDQKIRIEEVFENWRGKQKQIDDICLFGFKV